jgi:hypothetical protein
MPDLQDPILRLAIALYHNKGAYALLLGSGVSRSAGIPTGWEIVLDLTRQVAASYGERCEAGERGRLVCGEIRPTADIRRAIGSSHRLQGGTGNPTRELHRAQGRGHLQ